MESNGFGVIGVHVENDCVLLYNLFVNKDQRKKGIATYLIDKALEIIRNDKECKNKAVRCFVDDRGWLSDFYISKGIEIQTLI